MIRFLKVLWCGIRRKGHNFILRTLNGGFYDEEAWYECKDCGTEAEISDIDLTPKL